MRQTICAAINKYNIDDAIIYCNESGNIIRLKYKDVSAISNIFFENLKYLSKDSSCFGLLMDHNILIPSLIISLQQLDCSFLFLDAVQSEASGLINTIGIKYIIVYNLDCNICGTKFLFSIMVDLENSCDVYLSDTKAFIHKNINYIVQTSGTTSMRKVVRVENKCIKSNINCLRNRLQVTNADTIYFGTALTFDPSMIELYLALTTGAKLLILSKAIKDNPTLLYKILFQTETVDTTFLQMCPSTILLWTINDIENMLQYSSLRVLLLGGEDFPIILQNMKRSKILKVYNVYGITELSCWSFLAELNKGEEINLGNLLDNTIFEVKGKNSESINEGEGELFVGSFERICYLDNEQSAAVDKPVMRKTGDVVMVKDNKIIYKGRCDDVIKRFGNRVNLLYIEHSIQIHTGLKGVCIWLEKRYKLILYVVIKKINEVIASKIKDKLRIKILHVLPKECMPDYIELLPSLPLTKNGKVDKALLVLKANALLSRTTNLNRCLVDLFTSLWQNYFGNNYDFMTKTFYELGGTSITRIQFTEEIKQIYNGSSLIFDYIFTNTYDDVCNFLRGLQNSMSKRKLMDDDVSSNKVNKSNDKAELEICWSYDLQACVDCTPVVLAKSRRVAVGSFSNIFVVICIDTGQEIAKVVLPNAIESSCLVSSCENYVYIGCFDYNLYCIEVSTSEIVWVYSTGDRIKNKPVFVSDDAILCGSYDKYLYCVNCKTGAKLWQTHVGAPVTADILLIDDNIVVVTIRGYCWCLTKYGNVIWQVELNSPVLASPTRLKKGIIIPDVLGTVHYLSLSGEKLWDFKVDGSIYSSILAVKNYLIFGTHNSMIYCFEKLANDAVNPLLKHKINVESATSSTATTLAHNHCTYMVVTCIAGYVYLISISDFSIISKIKLRGEIFTSPVVFENRIFIGCRDNNLICIKVR